MGETEKATGQCLCGAVRFHADKVGQSDVCHCGMCRRLNSGPAFAAEAQGLVWQGEENITVYKSSDFAERGFCSLCGTGLFYRLTGDMPSYTNINTFLLDDQSGLDLVTEIFVDEQPAWYAFAGERKRMTGEQVIAEFMSAQGAKD
ncbi:MAG: GFA family protein [Pseudomonadota bacterium]